MIDVTRDKLLPLPEVARRFLPTPPGPAGLWRWHAQGVKVGDRLIRLDTIRVGRRRYTTEAAFKRFIEATNPDRPVDDDQAERQATTEAKLRERGLLNRPRKGRKPAPNTAG